jgi:flavin reductase (DIM6/NTAB) family NADH-FMN oxidoreductase RutF
MALKNITINDFTVKAHDQWANQWFLLSCGDFAKGHYNTMTVAWGSFGTMWGKPFAQVVVRPTRYTYEFMEKYNSFTLNALPEEYRKAKQIMGTRSGRDRNKINESGLTPVASTQVASPSFREADLIVECKKIYYDDFKPEHFLQSDIKSCYPLKDYHRFYFGEIVAVLK